MLQIKFLPFGAKLVHPSVKLPVDSLGCSPAAFDLAPGAYWCWRWPYSRRGSGGETTGGAIVWGSWLEVSLERGALGSSSWGGRPKRKPVKTPEPRQREEETDHKQDHEHMKDQTKPRYLKWGEEKAPW